MQQSISSKEFLLGGFSPHSNAYISLRRGRTTPVKLLLQQVKARVQLAALLSGQAVKRCAEKWWGGHAAAGDLLVLPSSPTLSPETEDVGNPREGTCWKKRRRKGVKHVSARAWERGC